MVPRWRQDGPSWSKKGQDRAKEAEKAGQEGGTWSKMGPRWAKMDPKGGKIGQNGCKKDLKVELWRAMLDKDATGRTNIGGPAECAGLLELEFGKN